jgi:hypothetical protein
MPSVVDWNSLLKTIDESKPKLDLAKHLFPGQDKFGLSTARQRIACTSRRAGKSEGCVAILIDTALKRSGCVALYVTKTRVNAKRIIWGILKRVNRDYDLRGRPNESELSMTFPNGSAIYLAGASHRDEIEKFRGMPIAVVVLDEAQILVGYLKQLIDEVLAPALMDFDGKLVLVGTPAPVPAGYFWECWGGKLKDAWEHSSWTVFDNPWILKKSGKTPRQLLDEELQRRGVTEEEPSIQREYFGRWVYDPNALVFRYEAAKNDFASLPTNVGQWSHVIGVDLGFDDADAVCVLSWSEHKKDVYLTRESVVSKQTITQLGDLLKKLAADYEPLAIVIDTGGLGKKIEMELGQRWQLGVEAAEKDRKLEHIELLNDALRSGRFFAPAGSKFAQDSMLVEWDKENPEKWEISDRYHSDICDAVLYAYRKALHWLSETPAEQKTFGSREWADEQAREQEAAHMGRLTARIAEQHREREEALADVYDYE